MRSIFRKNRFQFCATLIVSIMNKILLHCILNYELCSASRERRPTFKFKSLPGLSFMGLVSEVWNTRLQGSGTRRVKL